jgi:hypothetical protein
MYVKYNIVCDVLGQVLFKNIAWPSFLFFLKKKKKKKKKKKNFSQISPKNRPSDGPTLKKPKKPY